MPLPLFADPPIAYRMPFTTPIPIVDRAVGISLSPVVHVLLEGSYAATVLTAAPQPSGPSPPTTYIIPFIVAALASQRSGGGIGAFVVHVSVAGSYSSTVLI